MAKDQSRWLVGTLPQHKGVARVERIACGLVRIERKDKAPVVVGVISAKSVNCSDIAPLLAHADRPDMIINIPTRSSWLGEAIEMLEKEGVAFGKMYDLYRALNQEEDISAYKNPEYYFVERIFDQNRSVASRGRVSDRVYRIVRTSGSEVIVALLNEYEITADSIRSCYADNEPFQVIFITNPYARVSAQGNEAAESLGVELADVRKLNEVLNS